MKSDVQAKSDDQLDSQKFSEKNLQIPPLRGDLKKGGGVTPTYDP